MSPHPQGPQSISQPDVFADRLGHSDRFFSDDTVVGNLSAEGNPPDHANVASVPSAAVEGSAESVWFLEPANPDLMRYWEGGEAAWYPDPTNPDLIRYWDGSCWTNQVTPRPPPGIAQPDIDETPRQVKTSAQSHGQR